MQWLVQIEGTKHVSVFPNMTRLPHVERQRLKGLAAAHGGPFHSSAFGTAYSDGNLAARSRADMEGKPGAASSHRLYEWTNQDTAEARGVQRCLLQPGEVLWLPDGVSHDIFSLDASMTLNMRFGGLA